MDAHTARQERTMTRILLLAALIAACDLDKDTGENAPDPSERSVEDYGVSLPEDCPAYAFPDFQEPYGVLTCEVYIGCFGAYGDREEDGTMVDTVEACLELSCGGANGLEGEAECALDAQRAASCLDSMAAIADDLEGSCPDIDAAWFPPDCGMAISCIDD